MGTVGINGDRNGQKYSLTALGMKNKLGTEREARKHYLHICYNVDIPKNRS
jgi:hypothetical protein